MEVLRSFVRFDCHTKRGWSRFSFESGVSEMLNHVSTFITSGW